MQWAKTSLLPRLWRFPRSGGVVVSLTFNPRIISCQLKDSYQTSYSLRPLFTFCRIGNQAIKMRDKTYLDFRLYKDVQPKPRTKSRIVYLDYPHNQPWQAEPEPVSASEYDLVHLVKAIEPPTTRVLFVENATATMVNTLGSSLNLDPLFFADHFHTPSQDAYETPLQPLHSTLPPRIATSSQAHIHYYHPVAFKTTDHYVEVPHALKTRSNRPRNVRRMEGRDIAVAHGCCSFIVKTVGTSRICESLSSCPVRHLGPNTTRFVPCRPPNYFPRGAGHGNEKVMASPSFAW